VGLWFFPKFVYAQGLSKVMKSLMLRYIDGYQSAIAKRSIFLHDNSEFIKFLDTEEGASVKYLMGNVKDATTFYREFFPLIEIASVKEQEVVFNEAVFKNIDKETPLVLLPRETVDWSSKDLELFCLCNRFY